MAIALHLKNSYERLLPTLWRYFLAQYGKVFLLSLFGFLVILLSTRLEDFARFVTLGASLSHALLYVVYQIPYVLQIALPLSSLIASLFLFQKLSETRALTAIRATGMSLFELMAPLLLISSLVAIFTFYVILDMSASAHFAGKNLEFHLRSMNPLALMHNAKMLDEGGMSVEMNGSLQRDRLASNCIMAIRGKENGRTALFIAKELRVEGNHLKGAQLTLVSTLTSTDPNQYDHLILENAKENTIAIEDLSKAINTKHLKIGDDDLKFGLLIAKKNDLKKQLVERAGGKGKEKEKEKEKLGPSKKLLKDRLNHCYSELTRRVSLSFSIITFALLGAAFGSTTGRITSKKRLIPVVILTSLFLLCYLGAKAVESNAILASGLFITPHAFIITIAIRRLRHIQRGTE